MEQDTHIVGMPRCYAPVKVKNVSKSRRDSRPANAQNSVHDSFHADPVSLQVCPNVCKCYAVYSHPFNAKSVRAVQPVTLHAVGPKNCNLSCAFLKDGRRDDWAKGLVLFLLLHKPLQNTLVA